MSYNNERKVFMKIFKKLSAAVLALALLMICTVSVLADYPTTQEPDSINIFFSVRESDGLAVESGDWIGVGTAIDNDGTLVGIIEDVTRYDITEQAELENYLVAVFKSSTNEPSLIFSYNPVDADKYGVEMTVLDCGDGTYVAYVNLADALAKFVNDGNSTQGAAEYDIGIKVLADDFRLLDVYSLEETPTVKTESPKTGVAFVTLPVLVGAVAVVLSKKR